jgi:5'-deoxynucleotidase YfbR-like HD superfamily hydrolase
MMAVVHDLAEAIVGDIAPWEGISKADKMERERVSASCIRFLAMNL